MFPGIRTTSEYIQSIAPRGYELVEYFLLPEDAWWFDYFGPLEARIGELRWKYAEDLGPRRSSIANNEKLTCSRSIRSGMDLR
jgi:hypothetical protein